jgi:hypothetical protein
MHELVMLRNRRDTGGADVPIIFTDWDIHYIDKAIDFWVEQSKGQWSEEEYHQKCTLSTISSEYQSSIPNRASSGT